MKVEVSLLSTSQAIIHDDAHNTYIKDGMFCVYISGLGLVYKYPLQHIFRVTESYS